MSEITGEAQSRAARISAARGATRSLRQAVRRADKALAALEDAGELAGSYVLEQGEEPTQDLLDFVQVTKDGYPSSAKIEVIVLVHLDPDHPEGASA